MMHCSFDFVITTFVEERFVHYFDFCQRYGKTAADCYIFVDYNNICLILKELLSI